jgi:hypothetical protein
LVILLGFRREKMLASVHSFGDAAFPLYPSAGVYHLMGRGFLSVVRFVGWLVFLWACSWFLSLKVRDLAIKKPSSL